MQKRKSEELISLDQATKKEPRSDLSMNTLEAQLMKKQLI